MISMKYQRLKVGSEELISKSIELQEKGLKKSKLQVLGKSDSRNIFQKKRKRMATQSRVEERGEALGEQTKSSFKRYKTESVLEDKKYEEKNQSIDNIFNRLSRKRQARKKSILSQVQVKLHDQIDIKLQNPQIVIRDFNEELNHVKKSNAVNIVKFRLAHKQKQNYLFVPIHHLDAQPSQALQKQIQEQNIKQSINLPLLRQKKHTKQRPTSLLLDIESSLLLIDKKKAFRKEKSQHRSKDKSLSILRDSNGGRSPNDPLSLSPWNDEHSTPTNQSLFS